MTRAEAAQRDMSTHRSAFRSATVVDGCRRFGPSLESRTHVHLGLPEWWGCPCFLTATPLGRPILSQQILEVQYGDWRAKVRGKRGVHKGRKRGELTKWLISTLKDAQLSTSSIGICKVTAARIRLTPVSTDPIFPIFREAFFSRM